MDEQTVIDNLKEAGHFYSRADRVFLVDGDAFALSACSVNTFTTDNPLHYNSKAIYACLNYGEAGCPQESPFL